MMPGYNKITGAMEAPKEPTISAPTAALESVTYGCLKCCGTGRLPTFRHIESGLCFTCGGTGLVTGKRRPVDAVPVADPSKRCKTLTPAQIAIIEEATWVAADHNHGRPLVWDAGVIADLSGERVEYTLSIGISEVHEDATRYHIGGGDIRFAGKRGAWTDIVITDGLRRRINPRQAVALLNAIAR